MELWNMFAEWRSHIQEGYIGLRYRLRRRGMQCSDWIILFLTTTFFRSLFLLLMAHSASSVHKERLYLYHVHTVHFSPFHNTNNDTELTAAVLTDGENMVSEWMEGFWSRTRMKKQRVLQESEVFIDLLEISYNGSGDIVKRRDCEVERSSSGDVTSLSTTAEYRLNGEVILHFNVDTVQCVVLDSEFLPVEVVRTSPPSLSQIYKDYLVQTCMEELLGYLDHHERDSRRTEDDEFISRYRWLLLHIMFWIVWENIIRDPYTVQKTANVFDHLFSLTFYTTMINSIIFRIKKKMRKRKAGKTPVKSAYREDLNVMVNEDQDGGDADQTKRRFAASMDIPLTLAGEDDDYGQTRMTVASKDRLSRTARLITAGERFIASMDIPLTLADDEENDGQKLSEDRLAQTAGLTTAGGRWNSKNISLPNLASEGNDHSDSQ
ncbi:uncharacterized protein LOC118801031 isoform X2 [Colossoma macropomum]|uniref:uncharacterized protein LOC118801031 isoform X2 n=1 Tax=Colossoma macropomum TaxID=42526 RepID=UPI001864E5EF|nr:uncharacterized protein LOC118801031 isoform X2 [Colossoma macropomum]